MCVHTDAVVIKAVSKKQTKSETQEPTPGAGQITVGTRVYALAGSMGTLAGMRLPATVISKL